MGDIDINSLCKDYYEHKHKSENLGVQGINFSKLKIKVEKEPTWIKTQAQTAYEGPTSIVRVERQNPGLQAHGSVSTSRDNEMITRVEILSGSFTNLTGINSVVRMPLPMEIREQLGSSFEMNISKEYSKSVTKLNVQAQSSQEFPIGARGAQAEVTCKDHEYEGEFIAKLTMKGAIIVQHGLDQATSCQIESIVEHHHKKSPQLQSVLTVERKKDSSDAKVSWTMKGKCKFLWVNKQVIAWKEDEN